MIEQVILNPQPAQANISLESEFIDDYLVFESEYSQGGIVKTPKHIAELMCDLAELTANSKVLDITCGTGTFLSAAFENVKGKIPPIEVPGITDNFAGFDNNTYMAGIAKNIFHLHGINHRNIRKIDCFSDEAQEFVEEFAPNVILCNPPHTKDPGQQKEPLEFLKKACELCQENGIVIALMPMAGDTLVNTKSAKQKTLRRELLSNHRLVATMEMDREIFKIDPAGSISSNASVIVVMEPHTNGGHQAAHDVWMAMWKNDARRFVGGTGRIVSPRNIRIHGESVWQQMRQQWKWAFVNRKTIPLTRVPEPGQEPLFGASYKTNLEQDDRGNWIGDWIAIAGIPSPTTEEAKEEQLLRMNEAWEEYWKYSLLMR
jgi:SAM-dependent methyltransferase